MPVGLLGVAVLPAAIIAAEMRADIALIDAAVAIPPALLLGLLAFYLGRRGRRNAGRTLAARGAGAARVGRALGLLALFLGATGVLSVAWYAVLTWRGRS